MYVYLIQIYDLSLNSLQILLIRHFNTNLNLIQINEHYVYKSGTHQYKLH